MARPKKPIVSRELVIECALELIDGEGMTALSLRRLAEKVGVNIGSLYHHYRFKEDILRDVLVHVLAPLNRSPGPVLDWKDYFLQRSRTYVGLLVAHPNLAPLTFQLMPHEYGFSIEEQATEVLAEAGVPLRYALLVREQIESVIRGVMLFTFEAPLFANVPREYPRLADAVALAAQASAEERVEFAVRALLDGVEQRIPHWRRAAESLLDNQSVTD